jgi:hypothetical protein
MHYEINYDGLDPIEKHKKAIADVIEYTGQERFDRIISALRTKYPEPPVLEHLELVLSFAGIQGYPVKAIWNHIWGLHS